MHDTHLGNPCVRKWRDENDERGFDRLIQISGHQNVSLRTGFPRSTDPVGRSADTIDHLRRAALAATYAKYALDRGSEGESPRMSSSDKVRA